MIRLYKILIILSFYPLILSADIVMGVVPQQSPMKLLKVWKPIANYLSLKTGEKVFFKTERSINKFEDVLYSGGYDFAYMNPYHYVIANKKQNYIAKVRASKNINGILVVKKGENIDLLKRKKNRFLFPAPNAFAATLLSKYDLLEKFHVSKKSLDNAMYVNSHDSVYKGISRGLGDVGGGIERTFVNLGSKDMKNSLTIIHKTKDYPSHPFAFKKEMNEKIKKKIVDALLSVPKQILTPLSMKKLIKIDDSEYDAIRDIAVKLDLMY